YSDHAPPSRRLSASSRQSRTCRSNSIVSLRLIRFQRRSVSSFCLYLANESLQSLSHPPRCCGATARVGLHVRSDPKDSVGVIAVTSAVGPPAVQLLR